MPTTPSMTRSVVAETLSTIAAARLAERRQSLAVGAVRVEQHRVGGRAATTQKRRRPQRVTAVVARADDRTHPPTGDPAGAGGQLADDRGGQPVGRTLHQGTVGQAGQQRRFGLTDRVRRVVVPHHSQHSSACLALRYSSLVKEPFRTLRIIWHGQTTTPGT